MQRRCIYTSGLYGREKYGAQTQNERKVFLRNVYPYEQLASPIKIGCSVWNGTETTVSVSTVFSDPGHILQSLDSEISRSICSLSNSTGL